jgi:predicted membrane protein
MKKVQGIMWGLVLIALGVVLGGNALNWWNVDLFFDGWWTLFIIVPCTIGLITEKGERAGSLAGLVVGVLLLLACQDVISFDILWKMVLPIAVILIGVAIICKNLFNKKYEKEINNLNEKLKNEDAIGAVFSGQNINFAGEEFKGKTVGAVFGGMKLDLRKAKIKDDVVINAKAIFGGVEILVPDDVIVKVKSNSIFGGITNKKENAPDKKAPTIYINGTAVFGGVDIK